MQHFEERGKSRELDKVSDACTSPGTINQESFTRKTLVFTVSWAYHKICIVLTTDALSSAVGIWANTNPQSNQTHILPRPITVCANNHQNHSSSTTAPPPTSRSCADTQVTKSPRTLPTTHEGLHNRISATKRPSATSILRTPTPQLA